MRSGYFVLIFLAEEGRGILKGLKINTKLTFSYWGVQKSRVIDESSTAMYSYRCNDIPFSVHLLYILVSDDSFH